MVHKLSEKIHRGLWCMCMSMSIHIKDEDGWDDDEDWSDEIYNL